MSALTTRKLLSQTHLIAGTCLLLLAAVLALGALISSAPVQARSTPAGAPPAGAPPPGIPMLAGTIQSASSGTLTVKLTSAGKAVKIHLTSSTRYMVNGTPATRAPQWKKGERVQIIGTRQKNGTYTAQAVIVGTPPPGAGPPPGGPPPGGPPPPGSVKPLDGIVVSVSSSSLVVKAANGTKKTLHLGSGTRYFVNGKATSARPSLKAGTRVHVLASKSGTSLNAQLVIVGSTPQVLQGLPPSQHP